MEGVWFVVHAAKVGRIEPQSASSACSFRPRAETLETDTYRWLYEPAREPKRAGRARGVLLARRFRILR